MAVWLGSQLWYAVLPLAGKRFHAACKAHELESTYTPVPAQVHLCLSKDYAHHKSGPKHRTVSLESRVHPIPQPPPRASATDATVSDAQRLPALSSTSVSSSCSTSSPSFSGGSSNSFDLNGSSSSANGSTLGMDGHDQHNTKATWRRPFTAMHSLGLQLLQRKDVLKPPQAAAAAGAGAGRGGKRLAPVDLYSPTPAALAVMIHH